MTDRERPGSVPDVIWRISQWAPTWCVSPDARCPAGQGVLDVLLEDLVGQPLVH